MKEQTMLVQKWMSKEVISVDTDDPIQQAINLMKEHDIRVLPVMKDKKLVGIVDDGNLKKASASGYAAGCPGSAGPHLQDKN